MSSESVTSKSNDEEIEKNTLFGDEEHDKDTPLSDEEISRLIGAEKPHLNVKKSKKDV